MPPEPTQNDGGPEARVEFITMPHFQGLPLPAKMTANSAGFDLAAAVDEPVTLNPGAFALVPTGIAVAIPEGYEGQVRPRSGLAFKHGITVLNSPGTIDADYRGEVKALLINLGSSPFEVRRGDRIAQLVIGISPRVAFELVETLPETLRGSGGFGHTGK